MEKTKELFLQRSEQKREIQDSLHKRFVEAGEIWLGKVWVNIWSEISKDGDFIRPFLILKTWIWWDLATVVPFTTKYNENFAHQVIYFPEWKLYGLKHPSYLILNQVKTISIKRLISKLNNKKNTQWSIKKVSQNLRDTLKQKIIDFIF